MLNLLTVFIEEPPAKRPGHAETSVIGRTAPDPGDTGFHSRLANLNEQLANPERIQLKRMEPAAWQESQPVRLRRLHNRLVTFRIQPTGDLPLPAGGILPRKKTLTEAKRCGHHLPKSIPTIAHGQLLKLISLPSGSPTRRDRLRCLSSGEGALEFIGNNEDLA